MKEQRTRLTAKRGRFPTNEGAAWLVTSGKSTRELGKAFGVSHVSVGSWKRGDSVPDTPTRERIEAAGGPHRGAWDRRVAAPERDGALTPDAGRASPTDNAAELDALIRQLRAARGEPEITAMALARLAAVETRAVSAREALRELRDSAARSEEWRAILDRIAEALVGQPMALADVMVAVRQPGEPPHRLEGVREAHPEECRAVEAANAALLTALKGAKAAAA